MIFVVPSERPSEENYEGARPKGLAEINDSLGPQNAPGIVIIFWLGEGRRKKITRVPSPNGTCSRLTIPRVSQGVGSIILVQLDQFLASFCHSE